MNLASTFFNKSAPDILEFGLLLILLLLLLLGIERLYTKIKTTRKQKLQTLEELYRKEVEEETTTTKLPPSSTE